MSAERISSAALLRSPPSESAMRSAGAPTGARWVSLAAPPVLRATPSAEGSLRHEGLNIGEVTG
jgi:hypothetical protein